MRRALIAGVAAVAGYLAGAFGGGFLVGALTSNRHDAGIEAAMTGAFVLGPMAAAAALVAALMLTRRAG